MLWLLKIESVSPNRPLKSYVKVSGALTSSSHALLSIGYTRPKLLRLIFRMPTNSQLCKTPCIYSEIIT